MVTVLDIKLAVSALAVGIGVGLLFAKFKLPVPAPLELPGVLGVMGMYLGCKIFQTLLS